MIFNLKRHNTRRRSSGMEACISILGLLVAFGFVGGLAALIYGLVKGSLTGTIGGSVVLGVSATVSIIFVLAIIYCCKNNNNTNIVDSNANDRESSTNEHQSKQSRQVKPEQISSHEITIHKTDRQQEKKQPEEPGRRTCNLSISTHTTTDNTSHFHGIPLPKSPKVTPIGFFEQDSAFSNYHISSHP